MNNVKLNETPLRTSRNFGVNNINLEDLKIPSNLSRFENVTIFKDVEDTNITEKVSFKRLKYGTGEILENNISENANSQIQITTEKKDNIKIVYEFDEKNKDLAGYIDVQAMADLNLIIEYKSKTDEECFCNNILRLKAGENTKVNIIIINLVNQFSDTFEAIENEIDVGAEVNYTIIDLGGKRSVSNYYSNIVGEQAVNTLKTIYLGANSELKDLNYIAELKGKKSQVNIDVQGAIKDEAKKVFKGTIDFKSGCAESIGKENENCLLLSNKAKSLALPMLLCTEENVEGEHSTSSGKAEESELFYIMSRGISEKEAIKLIVKANFNNIIETIFDEEVKEEINEEIDKRLN